MSCCGLAHFTSTGLEPDRARARLRAISASVPSTPLDGKDKPLLDDRRLPDVQPAQLVRHRESLPYVREVPVSRPYPAEATCRCEQGGDHILDADDPETLVLEHAGHGTQEPIVAHGLAA